MSSRFSWLEPSRSTGTRPLFTRASAAAWRGRCTRRSRLTLVCPHGHVDARTWPRTSTSRSRRRHLVPDIRLPNAFSRGVPMEALGVPRDGTPVEAAPRASADLGRARALFRDADGAGSTGAARRSGARAPLRLHGAESTTSGGTAGISRFRPRALSGAWFNIEVLRPREGRRKRWSTRRHPRGGGRARGPSSPDAVFRSPRTTGTPRWGARRAHGAAIHGYAAFGPRWRSGAPFPPGATSTDTRGAGALTARPDAEAERLSSSPRRPRDPETSAASRGTCGGMARMSWRRDGDEAQPGMSDQQPPRRAASGWPRRRHPRGHHGAPPAPSVNATGNDPRSPGL